MKKEASMITDWLYQYGDNEISDKVESHLDMLEKQNTMKYIFRGHDIFEYDKRDKTVRQCKIHDIIPAFDFCRMIPEDYKLLSEFFNTVYRDIEFGDVELKDIEVD